MSTRWTLKLMKSVATALIVLLLGVANAQAARGDWTMLGERTVNDRAEYDTIVVGARKGRFAKLKLAVDNAPIEIKRVTVHFGDGSKQVVERNMFVGEDRRSPTLDLKGKRRIIEKVVFYYEAKSRGWERAKIDLYGRR